MALDPNILLQGVVPDIGKAVSQGFDLGQRIRNAPLLRKQAERKAQLEEQALQEGTEDEGTREAVALYQAAGDSPITVDNYSQVITTLQRGGHEFDEFEMQVTPENIATANQFKDMGKQSLLSARGKELQGWQSFAPQITVDPESGEQYFNIPQSNRQTGESRVQRVLVEDIIANNQGLTPDQQIQQTGGTAFAKAKQQALGEVSVAPQTAAAAAEQSRQVKMSEFQQATSVNAFKQAAAIDSQLGKVDKAIEALNNGAESGIVSRNLPSFKPATVQLEEAAKELGIDVINSATFGALSATELKLALDTALPLNLDEDELLPYLQDKKDAMIKLRNEMDRMGAFLSEKGNTVSKWRELQKEENAARGSSQATPTITTQAQFDALPKGASFIEDGRTMVKQ